jgi:hypothetical protein
MTGLISLRLGDLAEVISGLCLMAFDVSGSLVGVSVIAAQFKGDDMFDFPRFSGLDWPATQVAAAAIGREYPGAVLRCVAAAGH